MAASSASPLSSRGRLHTSWSFRTACIVLIVVLGLEYLDWNLITLSSSLSSSASTTMTANDMDVAGNSAGASPGGFRTTEQQQHLVSSSSSSASLSILVSDTSSVSLNPGELPGYTGWARPEFTVSNFSVFDFISVFH